MSAERSSREQLHEVLTSFEQGMLVTRTAEGALRARPMAVAEIDEDDAVWFTTSEGPGKIDEIAGDSHVCVTFQDGQRFLSLSGDAEVVHDRAKLSRVWNEAWRPWFPGGEDDPSLVLLRITPRDGEYWDRSGVQGLKYLFEAVRARVEHRQMRTDERQHGRVRL